MANMFYQMKSSIDDAFGQIGNGEIDKNSIKSEDFFSMKEHVFSYSERERLINTAADFAKWLKVEHSEIKMVKDLDSDIAKEYLLSKHREGGGTCNSNSVNTLEQGLDKIAILCSNKFGCDISMEVDHRKLPQDGEKMRSLIMDREVLHEALGTMRDGTQGKTCLEISEHTGLRAGEFEKLRVSDFDLDEGRLHIHESKGGRSRDIDINSQVVEIVRDWIDRKDLSVNDKLFTIRADSVCDLLQEGLKRVDHKEYLEAKTSLHSIRKMVAQDMYVDRIKHYLDDEKMDWKKAEIKALGDVAEHLGHGRQRTVEEYVDRFSSQADFEAAGY